SNSHQGDQMPAEMLDNANEYFPSTEAAPLTPMFGDSVNPAAERAREGSDGTLATFMYARMRNFTAACQTLAGAELTSFVNEVRRILSASALSLGGEIAQRRPDSILCVFSQKPVDKIPTHAKRALHAAILTVHECMQLASRFESRQPGG